MIITTHAGVSMPDPWSPDAIISALGPANFPYPLWLRIPLDAIVKRSWYAPWKKSVTPALTEYVPILRTLKTAGFKILLEICDSYDVLSAFPSLQDYMDRCTSVTAIIPRDCYDVAEIANEANGNWLGPDMLSKTTQAFRTFDRWAIPTALTLHSSFDPTEPEMREWAKKLPRDVQLGLSLVGVSHYDDDAEGPRNDWSQVISDLGTIFPNAALGILECGTERPEAKAEFIGRYYGMKVQHPRFVGGFYWWYGDDFLTGDRAGELRGVLAKAIGGAV